MEKQNNSRFDPQKFLAPDVSCAPIYIWVWNSACTRELIDEQLSEMQELGIRAFYILPEPKEFRPNSMPTELSPDYLTDEFFALCTYAIEKGRDKGMICWIYDEGGWPSGGACGKVLQDHPEYARKNLAVRDLRCTGGSVYKKTSSDVLAAFENDSKQIFEGYVFPEDTAVSEYFIEVKTPGKSDYPDLLNRSATEYFLAITHDGYAAALGENPGNSVSAVFTDEPKAPHAPFNQELVQKYEQAWGESVLPYLPLIAGRKKADENGARVLRRWYDICSRTFCENFLLPCKKWANDRGMAFTGHMDKDHEAIGCIRGGNNFHLMRALRCLDIPGIDVIWQQLYPESMSDTRDENNVVNGFFPRYASSAAVQTGTELALTESFGVVGPGVPFDIMRYTLGYQALRGINIFNFFNVPLGRKGALLAQELPIFTKEQQYYRDLPIFNAYTERLSYLGSLGRRDCETALYYPVNDFWSGINADEISDEFERLGRALEDRFVDFDIIDDDIIQTASGTDSGKLSAGRAVYKTIVIPGGAYIPPETEEILKKFVCSGGCLTYSTDGTVPQLRVEGASEGLRSMRRKIDGGELIFLFREDSVNRVYRVQLPYGKLSLLNLESGEIQKITAQNGIFEISLELGETAVLMAGDSLSAGEKPNFNREIPLESEFRFRKDRELTCSANGFENIPHSEDGVSLPLGSWAGAAGPEYSGSCVYETEFRISKDDAGKPCELSLGKVCYTATVELNGTDLGKVIMPPHSFKVPSGVLKEQNRLTVTVVNSPANWYVHTDYFDRWTEKQLSPYFKPELNYAREYADGGLYGPV
ncbi:MAG: beta galactosidase jelly roll domain-containing protein, partial [Clostridia bacterium]|nr:beta galactosidase jelly roll domain-containing protein [Clostridia bacterium]